MVSILIMSDIAITFHNPYGMFHHSINFIQFAEQFFTWFHIIVLVILFCNLIDIDTNLVDLINHPHNGGFKLIPCYIRRALCYTPNIFAHGFMMQACLLIQCCLFLRGHSYPENLCFHRSHLQHCFQATENAKILSSAPLIHGTQKR